MALNDIVIKHYNIIFVLIIFNMIFYWNITSFQPFILHTGINNITTFFAIILDLFLIYKGKFGSENLQNKKLPCAFSIIISSFFSDFIQEFNKIIEYFYFFILNFYFFSNFWNKYELL